MYKVVFSKRAEKDKKLLKSAELEAKAKELLNILRNDPLQTPPPYEKLIGELKGYYSRRINIQHRLVYSVDKNTKTVIVCSMWTHYQR